MRRLVFAVPGDLATPTGGYVYDRRMVAELGKLGWQVDVIDLGDGFPHASVSLKRAAQAKLVAAPTHCPIVVDGLAFGVLPDAAAALDGRNPLVALVHHPLALETGLAPEQARALQASERRALAFARHVIVTSPTTAAALIADYAVAGAHITVARPGCDRARPSAGRRDGPVRLLSVGAVVPRKGFDVLIAALATLVHLPWRLTIAGDRTRDPSAAARLGAAIARHGLAGRVDLVGALPQPRLAALYREADLFVLASRHEGYGMAFAEAIAHGLPVIGTTAGAIPDTVPAEAGVLVPPDDAAALAQALRRLIEDGEERHRLAHGARRAAAALPTWEESARLFARAVEGVA